MIAVPSPPGAPAMAPRRLARTLLAATVLALVPACGDSGGDDGASGDGPDLPRALVTVQERIPVADFEAEAQADAALMAVSAFTVAEVAGRVEDSAGVVVTWAEGEGKVAVRRCEEGVCAYAVVTRDADGVRWTDTQGVAVAPLTVGRPSLAKDLQGFALDGDTVVVTPAALTSQIQLQKDDLPTLDFSKRTLVALNTFGPAFGTTLDYVTAGAGAAFDEVVAIDYAREEDVYAQLRERDALDVVVWLTQGVRLETQGEGRAHQTVGFTVNRGVFGDLTFDRDAVAAPLAVNVGGGPGLLFLAAGDSYGDGSADQIAKGSVWEALDGLGSVVVGIEGHADVADVLRAAAAFLDTWLDGVTPLSDALAAGDAALAKSGARLRSNQLDESVTWTLPDAELAATLPLTTYSQARFVAPFTATPYCAPPGEDKQPEATTVTYGWADVTIDGAYFEGHRALNSSDLTVDTTVRGVFTGFSVGDRVQLEAIGDFDKFFRDFHGFGEAVIESVETDDEGKVTIAFRGIAHTAEYSDGDGNECVLNHPRIATTTSGPGKLELTP